MTRWMRASIWSELDGRSARKLRVLLDRATVGAAAEASETGARQRRPGESIPTRGGAALPH